MSQVRYPLHTWNELAQSWILIGTIEIEEGFKRALQAKRAVITVDGTNDFILEAVHPDNHGVGGDE